MSSGVRDFPSGMSIGRRRRVPARENTHDGPRTQAGHIQPDAETRRFFSASQPRRAASTRRKARLDHTLDHRGRPHMGVPSLPQLTAEQVLRDHAHIRARMREDVVDQAPVGVRERPEVPESRAWGWAHARDWRRRIRRLWRLGCTWREPKAHQAATKQIRARFIQDEARAHG
jgi:hypothetical protein